MSNKITIVTQPKNRITINNQHKQQVKSVSAGPYYDKFKNLLDVDATQADNNETVVYDEVSGKFVVKEIPIINGGTF